MLHRASLDLAASGQGGWRHVEAVFRAIFEILKEPSPEEFEAKLARSLAESLGCHTAFVAQLLEAGDGKQVRTIAVWSDGKPAGNFEYALKGTPCEEVLRAGLFLVESGVGERFPDDQAVAGIAAESYLGVALTGTGGDPVGHLAVLDDRPMSSHESSATIMRIFGARAEAHLDRRFVESRLRDVEDNFRLLFQHSPNPIILFDPETWKPVEFNDQAAEFMGYTREEFAALTISDLEVVPNPEETQEHIARILETGGDVFDAFHKARDGSLCHVIVSLRTTTWKGRRVMLTSWHDITARKAAEQALEASERRLKSIFDSAMDAVIIIDGRLTITRLNPAAERILMGNASEALGRPIQDFFPGPVLERLFSRARADGKRGGSGSVWAPQGLNALALNGQVVPVELTLSPFEIDNALFFTLIVRDVNDRKRAESEIRRLQADKRLLEELVSGETNVVAESEAMRAVLAHVAKVAVTDTTALIQGETGTGKELIARAIHQRSARRDRVMVTVNCAALPGDLLESELFGHEKGAFTGATQQRRGRFELANEGTLFLDEVGELPADAQAKLLRALQEGEIQRVGGEGTTRVNVRVIAATNRDLTALVQEGSFRSDLYYRLSVFPLRVPPLRERGDDIRLLADHFVGVYSKKFGQRFDRLDEASKHILQNHDWPGNVRELQNIVERAAILSKGTRLTIEPAMLHRFPAIDPASIDYEPVDDLDEATRRHLERVLKECRWVVEGSRGAAVRLGLKPSTLRFRMRKLGIRKP